MIGLLNPWEFGTIAMLCGVAVVGLLRSGGSVLSFDVRGVKATVEAVAASVGPRNGETVHDALAGIEATLAQLVDTDNYLHQSSHAIRNVIGALVLTLPGILEPYETLFAVMARQPRGGSPM